MSTDFTKTMKLRLYTDDTADGEFSTLSEQYRLACDFVSQYVFDHDFILNSVQLSTLLYTKIRDDYNLKSQMAQSVIRTVTARYAAVRTQLYEHPYKYKDESEKWCYIPKTLEWLWRPISFKRPQADLVRGRDYSFVDGCTKLSLNTLSKRVKVRFAVPPCFKEYFDGTWSFGTGKLVKLNGIWYFHIPVTKIIDELDRDNIKHVVGIDQGLRFLTTTYDEKGDTVFTNGKSILAKRQKFQDVRSELQSKGTRSAKRALKHISGRENRWMSDVNHQISKTLVESYGADTLFVVEDLTGVSFDEKNLSECTKQGRRKLRSWTFYQLTQDLTYKAKSVGSDVIKVRADYTSQRCPKCGRIHKENRHHDTHEYICDKCGYRSNDDRIGAMNIQLLGTMYVSGDNNPSFVNQTL